MSILLRDVPFFEGLSDSELEFVQTCLREKSFEKGQPIFQEGQSCERVFFVRAGRVKIYRSVGNGKEQILETLGPGDTCACNPARASWSCSSNAEAIENTELWLLDRTEYVRMVQTDLRLSLSLNRLFAERLQCFGALVEEVSLKDSKKRLVKFLLDLLDDSPAKTGLRGLLTLAFTREEIAQRLGITRETCSRQLAQLKERKLIDLKPSQIIILNRRGLEKILEA